ncbi:phage antirepressor [Apilactobacillus xinyiensis]|uniref:phage antirepressor n=1 Tax=Apilactobacillus xinyiensis TaxID=2841032 RepID=UPI00200BF41D|nr:phage antirepressor KilAC domain-containing protein [Apilactobacillus xinyiensis]MCL0330564.1 phage antirepressor KilAC domain-containing protein [Apilactobacillus xinyiensis]
MKNELQPFNFEGNQVRSKLINGKPYFVAKDVALAIGYKDTTNAIKKHVKNKYKVGGCQITTPSGIQEMTMISEPGIYQLAGQSRLPKAEPFQDWIFEEVLPSINHTGSYQSESKQPSSVIELLQDPDNLLKLVTNYKKVSDENKTMKPKAIFADAVSASHSTILVGDLAKLLKQNGVNIGATRLFRWLRENGYLIRRKGSDYNTPTQRSMEMKLFRTKETSITHSDGHTTVNKTPKVTGKGQQYFINKFLKLNDIDISGQLPTELEG